MLTSNQVRNNHKGPSDSDLPANLQMQRCSADKDPHNGGPASEDEKGARGGANPAGGHVVGCDLVVALIRVACKRQNESKLEVVSVK